MTEFQMPERVNLVFVGNKDLEPKKLRYRGDGLLCHLDHPESCKVLVKPLKAKQLFVDFPNEWKIPGDAAKASQLRRAIVNLPDPIDLESGASVQSIEGVAKIIAADGTEIVLPKGSKVTVEVGR